jgi:starch synthase
MDLNFMRSKNKLKILFIGSEAAPFIKVGGLGEVLYSLPKALNELGHDVRVMIPNYSSMDREKFACDMVIDGLEVPDEGSFPLMCNVKMYKNKEGHTNYFLENEEYFEKRGSVYGYDDDASRWALLAKAAIEFIRHEKGWKPDIIVANDWQGGLIPNFMKINYADDPVVSKIAVLFIIHNIYFQGMFDHRHINELDYDDGQSHIPSILDSRMKTLNLMRRGIRYADVICTVSPNYAREITTPEYGEKLDTLLKEKRSRLFGILNGINYDIYNPETNPHIEYHYNYKNVQNKIRNKKILQQKFNLPERDDVFICGIVSRLSEQKGLDLVMKAMPEMLNNFDFQFVVLGSGSSKYMAFFEDLAKKHKNVATHLSFDDILPHVIYAGADSILIPSRFEPSGLTQMEAMRYGAVPIVRKIGGLSDSVKDVNPQKQTGNGFVFEKYDHFALFSAFTRAYETYKYPEIWQAIVKSAMMANFSWEKSAKDYVRLFERALDQINRK